MAQLKGRGVVWGAEGITFSAGIVTGGTSAHFNQSASHSRSAESSKVKDGNGVIRAIAYHSHMRTISITVIPAAPTGTNSMAGARASADSFMLQGGTAITVVDADGTIADGTFNLLSARQGRTLGEAATIDLELEAGDETGVDTTTPVSGF